MAERENLKLYNEDKYWNLDVKDEFMAQTRSLWHGNFKSKYDGSIFQVPTIADEEESLMQMKVDRELKEAIQKHGEVQVPELFEDQLKEKIENAKKKIAAMWNKNQWQHTLAHMDNECFLPLVASLYFYLNLFPFG